MIDRNYGKEILSNILQNKNNVEIIENDIHKYYKHNYIDTIYQVIGILMEYSVKFTHDLIANKKLPWNFSFFQKEIENENIEMDFIESPFEKTESILKCVCGSSNVMTFSKQLRSSDEGTSVIAVCIDCKKRWVEGG